MMLTKRCWWLAAEFGLWDHDPLRVFCVFVCSAGSVTDELAKQMTPEKQLQNYSLATTCCQQLAQIVVELSGPLAERSLPAQQPQMTGESPRTVGLSHGWTKTETKHSL